MPRKPPALRSWLVAGVVGLGVSAAGALAQPAAPIGVSPGQPERPSSVAAACPTFSWSAVAGAAAYELAVFALPSRLGTEDARPAVDALSTEPLEPVLRQTLPAGASSFTPDLGKCLEPGRSYVWYVRAIGAEHAAPGDWSRGNLFALSAAGGPTSGDGAAGKPEKEKGGTKASLARLEANVAALQVQVAELAGELIPCTLERFAAGLCTGNHPLDLVVTVCGVFQVGGEFEGNFEVLNHNYLELGIGWGEAVVANLTRQVEFPGIPGAALLPFPISVLYGSPLPNLRLAANGAGGLELHGCLEGIEVPVGEQVDDATVLALLGRLESGAVELRDRAMEAAADRGLTPESLANFVEALRTFERDDLSSIADAGLADPLGLFDRGRSVRVLADALPVGSRFTTLMDNPSRLIPQVLPADAGEVALICQDPLAFENVGPPMAKICEVLDRDVPSLPGVNAAIDALQGFELAGVQAGQEALASLVGNVQDSVGNLQAGVDSAPADVAEAVCERLPGGCNVVCSPACEVSFNACNGGCEASYKTCTGGCNSSRTSCRNRCNVTNPRDCLRDGNCACKRSCDTTWRSCLGGCSSTRSGCRSSCAATRDGCCGG